MKLCPPTVHTQKNSPFLFSVWGDCSPTWRKQGRQSSIHVLFSPCDVITSESWQVVIKSCRKEKSPVLCTFLACELTLSFFPLPFFSSLLQSELLGKAEKKEKWKKTCLNFGSISNLFVIGCQDQRNSKNCFTEWATWLETLWPGPWLVTNRIKMARWYTLIYLTLPP